MIGLLVSGRPHPLPRRPHTELDLLNSLKLALIYSGLTLMSLPHIKEQTPHYSSSLSLGCVMADRWPTLHLAASTPHAGNTLSIRIWRSLYCVWPRRRWRVGWVGVYVGGGGCVRKGTTPSFTVLGGNRKWHHQLVVPGCCLSGLDLRD